jgi:hypothetical protein
MPLLDEVNEMGSFHVLHHVQDVDARDKRTAVRLVFCWARCTALILMVSRVLRLNWT